MCKILAIIISILIVAVAADELENTVDSVGLDNSTRQFNPLEWIFGPTTTQASKTTTISPFANRTCGTECICGQINTIRRIVGGQTTYEHQYPWMAMLRYNNRFYCGASLINDLYVLTAAHCVKNFRKERLKVRFLEHGLINSSAVYFERTVANVIVHEKYSTRNYDSDIALVQLSEPVEFSPKLRPACLPTADKLFSGNEAIVTGWGATSEGGQAAATLQEVKVCVYSQDQCYKSNYGQRRITDNMLCAGYPSGGKDSCQGDSGGPLHVVQSTDEHQLAGIVSWGEGCARPNSPGVYTRVSRFGPWIEKHTSDACQCSSKYSQPPKEEEVTTATENPTEAPNNTVGNQ